MKLINITREEWAWLAGLIDGEGTVSFYMDPGRHSNKFPQIVPYINVANTNITLLQTIKDKTGCGAIINQKSGGFGVSPEYSKTRIWRVNTMNLCQQIIENTSKYLIVKQYPAQQLLKFCKRKRGMYTRADLECYENVKKFYYNIRPNPNSLTSKYYKVLKDAIMQGVDNEPKESNY